MQKEGFIRTYIRPHQNTNHSHHAGGHHGAIKCVGTDEFGNKYYEDWTVGRKIFIIFKI